MTAPTTGAKTPRSPGEERSRPVASDDPVDRQMRRSSALRSPLVGLADELSWWIRTLRLETRSFRGRIRTLCGKRRGPAANDLGPLYEESLDGHLSLSGSTLHCSQSIQSLFAMYPWASETDVMLVLDGWKMGTQFAIRSEGTRSMEKAKAS
jgi:hypothetical protein